MSNMEVIHSNKVFDQLIERLLKLGNCRLNSTKENKTDPSLKKSIESDLMEALEEGINYLLESEKEIIKRTEMQVEWKNKIKQYSDRIQKMTVQKNIRIPLLIHKETETCVMDFRDLSSTVSDNLRKNERLQNYYKQTSKVNEKLTQELDVATNYLSFIDEKLEEIEESERKILAEKKAVTENLNQTRDKALATKEKYKMVVENTNERRGLLKERETQLENELAEKIAKLKKIKQNRAKEIDKIQRTQASRTTKLKQVNELETNLATTKMEETKKLNEFNATKQNLAKIVKNEQVKEKNLSIKQEELARTVERCAEGCQAMVTATKNLERELDDVKRDAIQTNIKIEEFGRKKAVLEDDISMQDSMKTRMENEIDATLLQIEEESTRLMSILEQRDDLQTEYCKSSTCNKSSEESMQQEMNSLKESLSNTISRKSMLEASISQTKKELKIFKKENEIRTKMLLNKHDKYSRLQRDMEYDRTTEQDGLKVLQRNVEDIQTQIDKILEDRNEVFENPYKRLNELKQNSIELQEKRAYQQGRMEGLKEHVRLVDREIKELETNIEGMLIIIDNLHSELTKANYQSSSLNEQYNYSQTLLEGQKERLQGILDKTSLTEATHTESLSDLENRNLQLTREINSRLNENEQLAGEFKRLNLELFVKKMTAGEFYGSLFELVQFDQLIEEVKYIVQEWLIDLGDMGEFEVADFGSRLNRVVANTINNDINMQYFINNVGEESKDLFDYVKDEFEAGLTRGHC